MQDETTVYTLCQALEARITESEQALDALYMASALDDGALGQLCAVAHRVTQFCVEASNHEQFMDEFAARSTRKMSELRRLYQQLGGRERALVHAQRDTIDLCAINGAIILSDAAPQRAPLTPLLCHQFDTERGEMPQYMDQCGEIEGWPCALQEATSILRARDAVDVSDVVREALPLFALDDALRSAARALHTERENIRSHMTNVVERYAQCSHLVDQSLAPQPPLFPAMASMFVPI